MALFVTGRAEEGGNDTLRNLPATGKKDVDTLAALTQMTVLITVFGDRDTAQAAYHLLSRQVAETGATGTGSVFVGGSLHRQLSRMAARQAAAEARRLDMPGSAGCAERSAIPDLLPLR